MYQIQLEKRVKKFLTSHPEIARRFFDKTRDICNNPYDNFTDIKPLKGHTHCYRLRIGKYRFLYEIKDKEIIIYFYDADSRGDVYK